jgi:5-methyltetrahydrofolate--homocysteine methyltransferase
MCEDVTMELIVQQIYDSIVAGEAPVVVEKLEEALEAKIPLDKIVNEGMIAAMGEVGRLFERGEYFVPEMLVAARAMQRGMAYLKPYLATAGIQSIGKIVIGTVKGDLHDIGKNLVSVMLEGAGFAILDLGTDVPADRFVEVVKTEKPDILAMSALLTTTMPNFNGVLQALENSGVRQEVKVLIGGAPVTQAYAQQLGADGYAPDASRAVAAAKALVGI